MKTLSGMLVALAMVSPLSAGYIVVEESFDGAAGTAVDGWHGWTLASGAPGTISISSATVDQGNSAGWSGTTAWPSVTKTFSSYTPTAGDPFVFTATLSTGTDNSGYSDLRLKNSSNGNFVQMCMGLESDIFVNKNGSDKEGEYVHCGPRATKEDMMIVLTDTSAQAFTRAHGAATWDEMGTVALGSGFSLSGYDTMVLYGQASGGIDSIRVTAGTVPEPTAITLLGIGMIGLLAYAWRKR